MVAQIRKLLLEHNSSSYIQSNPIPTVLFRHSFNRYHQITVLPSRLPYTDFLQASLNRHPYRTPHFQHSFNRYHQASVLIIPPPAALSNPARLGHRSQLYSPLPAVVRGRSVGIPSWPPPRARRSVRDGALINLFNLK